MQLSLLVITKVALQFPDLMLCDAEYVTSAIQVLLVFIWLWNRNDSNWTLISIFLVILLSVRAVSIL